MLADGSLARGAFQLPLLKIGAGARVEATLQREDPLWVSTHWAFRQQWLCVRGGEEECPGCVGQMPRVTGFVTVLVVVGGKRLPFLLEVTAHVWAQLRGLAEMEWGGVVAGGHVSIRRSRQSAPLRIEPMETGGFVSPELASFRRLASAVAIVFGMPLPMAQEEPRSWADRCRPVALAKLQKATSGLAV